jgi:hypothetical protein
MSTHSTSSQRKEPALPYPHSSAVQGADQHGFGRAVAAAQARLDLIEEDQT